MGMRGRRKQAEEKPMNQKKKNPEQDMRYITKYKAPKNETKRKCFYFG